MHDHGADRSTGFTLLELLMVITILALTGQIVVMNLPALIPSTRLDSTARTLSNTIEFARSEAQLNADTYVIELDLDRNRWRILLPVEAKLTSREITADDEGQLVWNQLDRDVEFAGYHIVGGATQRSGTAQIRFDPHGFTADQAIFLKLAGDTETDLMWTLQLRGLDRETKIVKDSDGKPQAPTPVNEADFR